MYTELLIKSRAELREWLAENHSSAGTLWLVSYKKHTKFYVSYGDIVSELLCWGWIDSVKRMMDDEFTCIRISPRNPKSGWSGVNKIKVDELRASGMMMPAGEAVIAKAKQNGMWDFLDDVEGLVLPNDLVMSEGFDLAIWAKWTRTMKFVALHRLKSAKTAATRQKRIKEICATMGEGLPPASKELEI